MNNQAAQTMPELPVPWSDFWAKKGNWALSHDYAAFELALEWLQANAAALSQTAGVPFGHAMFNAKGACVGFRQNHGFGYNFTVADFLRADEIMPDGAPHTGCLVYAAAPAASGGEDAVGCTCGACPLPAGCKIGDCMHGLDNTPEESNPPAGASVSERARVSLDLNNLPAEWPWDEGSPCLDPRPVGMVYPAVPTPRAFGYLDKTGVEWAAYDTGQMEEYGRRAFADGANTVLHAVDQAVNDLWSSDAYRRGWSDCAMTNGLTLEQALTQQWGDGEAVDRDAWAEALELPQGYTVEEFLPGGWHYAWTRADGERMVSGTTWNHPALAAIAAWQYAPATTPQPGAEALRELVQRWREVAKSTFSRRTAEMYTHFADELESLLARGG